MDIRQIREYRFHTKAEIENAMHDRRHRRGIESHKAIPAGAVVRVEVRQWFDDDGQEVGRPHKSFFVMGACIREEGMVASLEAQDAGVDEGALSLPELAARHYCDTPWFALSVLEKMVSAGEVTLDQIEKHWVAIQEDPAAG